VLFLHVDKFFQNRFTGKGLIYTLFVVAGMSKQGAALFGMIATAVKLVSDGKIEYVNFPKHAFWLPTASYF